MSKVNGEAGDFNDNLRKEVFKVFKAKSSKLPAHFTIKAPFEMDNIEDLEKVLYDFSKRNRASNYDIKNYSYFDNRVIYMKVLMSKEGYKIHDELIEAISSCKGIEFKKGEGKDKIFHVTVASKKIQDKFNDIWEYVNRFPCEFHCKFDNVSIYKWEDISWKLYKEYKLI